MAGMEEKAAGLRDRQGRRVAARAALLRRGAAGQSLIVAIIVLFLLLVLGAAFVALVANNLRNARQSARRLSADDYAQAGVRYMDEQLTNSPDGADWRPAPDGVTDRNDPDYYWLKPYVSNPASPDYDTGGFTRVNYGGDTPGSPGGRALIRVTYRPDIATTGGTGGGTILVDPQNTAVDDTANAEVRKYIKLESIGRIGVIDSADPTTYNNSDALGMRRTLVAYKQIGLTDYLRFITNKNNKPTPATLGSSIQVLDAATSFDTPAGGTFATAPTLQTYDVPSYYIGPIRSNAPLTFYGYNNFFLDSRRGDAIQVAGPISLANDDPNVGGTGLAYPTATPAGIQGNPAIVSLTDLDTATNTTGVNVYPSTSSAFDTYRGLVRDNPAGGNTQGLSDVSNSRNLRSVPRSTPPAIDAPGTNGVTRYRALTRDSAALTQTDVPVTVAANTPSPGSFGWGQFLYLNNAGDVQRPSSLINLYSLRTDWLNPGSGNGGGYWKGDFEYVPPGITITLTPRYIVLTRTGDQTYNSTSFVDRFRFFTQANQQIENTTILRYTYDNLNGLGNRPFATTSTTAVGETVSDGAKFGGYPATLQTVNGASYFQGDFVIYAEGNVRIRGVVGGLDPETQKYFLRHLTVVSGGTIYIDGNLLRDNITPQVLQNDNTGTAAAVRGQSSIALLAHDYVAVNTTQFLKPFSGFDQFAAVQPGQAVSLFLDAKPDQQFPFTMEAGPIDANNTPPSAVNNYLAPSIYFRHESGSAGSASINLVVNGALYANFPLPTPMSVPSVLQLNNNDTDPAFIDEVDPLTPTLLYPNPAPPFTAGPPEIGTPNQLAIQYDSSAAGQNNAQQYDLTRLGITPRDVRIEAILYAQEGSFFIIPGPWFNPDPNDTYASYLGPDPSGNGQYLHRPGNSSKRDAHGAIIPITPVDPRFPFYGQPQDIRIAFYGSITENLPAEVGDQAAWLQKWGWIPKYQGSTGLPLNTNYSQTDPDNGSVGTTVHGPLSAATYPAPNNGYNLSEYLYQAYTGSGVQGVPIGANPQLPVGGIVYEYDPRASSPYHVTTNGAVVTATPIRPNPYRATEPLPLTPRLPVEPGLLYVGEQPVVTGQP